MRYIWEKFYRALFSLTGKGNQRERLINAFAGQLIHLDPEKFPGKLREEFVKIKNEITKVEPEGDEGSIAATVNWMEDNEVNRMIERIINLYEAIVILYKCED